VLNQTKALNNNEKRDYTHKYPVTLPIVGTDQISRLNARCLPIATQI